MDLLDYYAQLSSALVKIPKLSLVEVNQVTDTEGMKPSVFSASICNS